MPTKTISNVTHGICRIAIKLRLVLTGLIPSRKPNQGHQQRKHKPYERNPQRESAVGERARDLLK
jgi:collagenase-like PrtC family protease